MQLLQTKFTANEIAASVNAANAIVANKFDANAVSANLFAANTIVETLMEDEPTAPTTVDTKEETAPKISVVDDDKDDAMSYFEQLVADEETK